MKISRRDFVAYGSGLLSSMVPFFGIGESWQRTKCDARIAPFSQDNNKKILVLIHLAGGNDWLNTIIPYKVKSYYRNRPSLAVSPQDSIKLDQEYALHPSLIELKQLYDQNQVAILLNAGYAQTILSHHKAIENLQYAFGDRSLELTWQGHYANYMRQQGAGELIFPTINVEPRFSNLEAGKVVSQEQIFVSSLTASNKFKFDLDNHYRLHRSPGGSDNENGFGKAMTWIAKSIMNNANTTIFNISLGGFDTHANQAGKHAYLLKMLSKALFFFQADLKNGGVADRVLTLVVSEFGRSHAENDNLGTDHGYENHVLAIGESIEAGIYGNKNDHASKRDDSNKDWANLQTMSLDWVSCSSKFSESLACWRPNRAIY